MMVIATRTLKLVGTKDEVKIPIRIFSPEDEGDAWSCRYEIDWPEGTQVMTSWGRDSAQALILAMRMIGADIYSSTYHKSGRLMLEASGNGYGFPVPSSLRGLLEGDDAKYF
jgi:hypothetical protein